MPELPEVETVRTGLEEAIKGAAIRKVTLKRGDLRVPFPKNMAETLTGRTIERIGRRAKYLLFHLDSNEVLIAHLGMTGRFSLCHPAFIAGSPETREMPQQVRHDNKHDHVIFELADGRTLVFNDARRFGLMQLAKNDALEAHPLFSGLGPEPFEKAFSSSYLRKALEKRKGPIKPVLMDQKLVVGVGNIYASEALFLAGIDPRKPADKVAGKAADMIASIRRVLTDAIASGGSSLRDFLHITGYAGDYQNRFKVYGRKGKSCFSCHTEIRILRQAGRSTFFCPECQK